MYDIVSKARLSGNASRMALFCPPIARKAQAGQFVILRAFSHSERIPLTIHDHDPEAGTVTVVYQVVGAGTMELDALGEGDSLHDLAGPLGRPTATEGIHNACVIGGGVGCAIAYPVAKKLRAQGSAVHSVIGFRNRDLVFLEEEFQKVSDLLMVMTDDGSHGRKGFVTGALTELLERGETYDEVIAIGPLVMMKSVCAVTRAHGIRTTVSMNPVMVDGTGMCGGCRLTVGGEMKFACVDGPDFDGHLVDFDEVMDRNRMYEEFEKRTREESCKLLQQMGG
ncbi:MAG TPA: sulfide/dihydroorotate dehydrogenase-like FAD/NAD-binding protein [Candidatus Limnocylindria bacterium]|nr:sulfide/dihydroorotate dehydrogenase-like FAD/NAD-binding protein [Candidatus Limnocylindria bacterium]